MSSRLRFSAIAVLLAAPVFASTITPVHLTRPQQMCAEVACFEVAAGEAGIYANPFAKNPLAFATLNQDTDFAGVVVPAGSRIDFAEPGQSDYDFINFSVTLTALNHTAGFAFRSGTKLGFGRYLSHWDAATATLGYVAREKDDVVLRGTLDAAITIDDVALAAGSEVLAKSTVMDLMAQHPTDTHLSRGRVGEPSQFPAALHPIELLPREVVTLSAASLVLDVGNRVLNPEGYHARVAVYALPSGRYLSLGLTQPAMIQGLLVTEDVHFFPNGNIQNAVPAPAVNQTLSGVAFDGTITYYGDVQLYDNGNLLTIPTVLVAANSALLPPDLVAKLPSRLQEDDDRIQIFLNPQGEVRAFVLEGRFPKVDSLRYVHDVYFVDGKAGNYSFRLGTPKTDKFSAAFARSDRGFVEPTAKQYLLTH